MYNKERKKKYDKESGQYVSLNVTLPRWFGSIEKHNQTHLLH